MAGGRKVWRFGGFCSKMVPNYDPAFVFNSVYCNSSWLWCLNASFICGTFMFGYWLWYSNIKGTIFPVISSFIVLTKPQILLRGLIVYLHLGQLFNLQRWQLWAGQLCVVSAFVQFHPFPLHPICKQSREESHGTYGLSLAHLSVFVWATAGVPHTHWLSRGTM